MNSFQTMLTIHHHEAGFAPYDEDIDIVVDYLVANDGEVTVEEVTLEHDDSPLPEGLFDRFEEEIYDLAREHACSEDGQAAYLGDLADYAYDRWQDERMGL